jgi:hypothetical protein
VKEDEDVRAGRWDGLGKVEYPDGVGCSLWRVFPEGDENIGICWDFTFDELDDIISLLESLKNEPVIHILKEMGREVPVIFVDTGLMFDETLFLRGRVAAMGVEVVTFIPQAYPVPCDVVRMGRCESPDEERIAFCCAARRVEPMRRALDLLKPGAILTARGRFQSVTRQGLPFFEGDRSPPRINPMVLWSQEQIEQYVEDHHVPHTLCTTTDTSRSAAGLAPGR